MSAHPDTDPAAAVRSRPRTRSGGTPAWLRPVAAAVLAVAACLFGYTAVHATLGVRADARELSWLQTAGTRARVTVTEGGFTRPDGSLLQYWARDPGTSAPVFIDAAASPGRTSTVGTEVSVVLDRRLQPTTGVPVDSLGRSFTGAYLRRVLPPGVLTIVFGAAAVTARRRPPKSRR